MRWLALISGNFTLSAGSLQGNVLAPYLIVSDDVVGIISLSITKSNYNINMFKVEVCKSSSITHIQINVV